MAQQSLKIDHILYLLTLDGERRIIQDAAVLVENGRIRRVGKAAELADARADRVIDGRSMVRNDCKVTAVNCAAVAGNSPVP